MTDNGKEVFCCDNQSDFELLQMVTENGELFEDMLFAEDSFSHSCIKVQVLGDDGVTWLDDELPLPYPLGSEYFFYSDICLYRVERFTGGLHAAFFTPEDKGIEGRLRKLIDNFLTRHEKNPDSISKEDWAALEQLLKSLSAEEDDVSHYPTLAVDPDYLYDQNIILHEMIHLHEYILSTVPSYFRDIYFISLYREVKRLIPNIDEIIDKYSHMLYYEAVERLGGVHDLLFLLKSFHLDVSTDQEPGTVLGLDYFNIGR